MDFEEFKSKWQEKPVEYYPNNVPDEPLVSICIQTYQHADYITDCLEGIIMQETDFSYEILLGEDDSSDGTREICIKYAEKYPSRIRLFLHSRENNIKINGRATGRFNLLFNLFSARGKYIALCEGDDYWTDSLKLQKQIDILEKNENVILCCHAAIELDFRTNERKIICRNLNQDGILPTKEIITNRGGYIPTASIIFRNDNYSELYDFLESAPIGDFFLQSYLALRGDVYFLDMAGCVYRRNTKDSWTHEQKEKEKKIRYYYDMFNAIDSFYSLNKIGNKNYLVEPISFYLVNFVFSHQNIWEKIFVFCRAIWSIKSAGKINVFSKSFRYLSKRVFNFNLIT